MQHVDTREAVVTSEKNDIDRMCMHPNLCC